MKRAVARAAAAAALVVVGTVGSAYAQQLPRTGSIAFHTGWKFTGELKKLGPAHMQGHGTVSGVTFNDSGSGPLHLGPANCFDVFFVVDGKGLRKLTLREGLRLFGYPEDYRFEVSEKDGFDLLGNTVVVPVIEAVCERLLTNIKF